MSTKLTTEDALRVIRNSVAEVQYKDLPPKARKEAIRVSAIVSGPSSRSLSRSELGGLVQGAFAQIGMNVQCYEAPNNLGSPSLVVRDEGESEITKLDPRKDVAYVPNSRGFRSNEKLYEREIDLNPSLINKYTELVGLLEHDGFYVRRVNEGTISDTTYDVEFKGSVMVSSKK